MADNSHLRSADFQPPDDDPFAELTKIMGFDPREPVRREPSREAEAPGFAPDNDDDLSLDLERELMGEFPADQEPESPAPVAWAEQAPLQDDPDMLDALEAELSLHEDPEPAYASAQDLASASDDEPEGQGRFGSEDRFSAESTFSAEDVFSAEDEELPAEASRAVEPHDRSDAGPGAGFENAERVQDAAGREADDASAFDDEPADVAWETAEQDEDLPVLPVGSARKFDIGADDSLASIDMDFENELTEALDVAPASEAAPDLEDELRALLGYTDAKATSQPAYPTPAQAVGQDSEDPRAIAEPEEQDDLADIEAVFAEPAASIFAPEGEAAAAYMPEGPEPDQAAWEPQADELALHLDEADLAPEQPASAGRGEWFRDAAVEAQEAEAPSEDWRAASDAAEPVDYRVADEADEDRALEPARDAADEWQFDAQEETGAMEPVSDGEPEEEAPQAEERQEDPFAALAAMVRGSRHAAPAASAATAPGIAASVAQAAAPAADPASSNVHSSAASAAGQDQVVSSNVYQYQSSYSAKPNPAAVPEIETVDVAEAPVAYADDLDLPELAYEADQPATSDLDDFEAELAGAFGTPVPSPAKEAEQAEWAAPASGTYDSGYAAAEAGAGYGYAAGAAAGVAAAGATAAMRGQPQAQSYSYQDFDLGLDELNEGQRQPSEEDFGYRSDAGEEMAEDYSERQARPAPRKRRWLFGGLIGGIAVIGGIGALALSFSGGDSSDAPTLVQAGDQPIKVRPENPGGTTVPNQDNQVFQAMNGNDKPAAPSQETLISSGEEPIDIAAQTVAASPEPSEEEALGVDDGAIAAEEGTDQVASALASGQKLEDRVSPAEAGGSPVSSEESIAVAPRRVRTMVVRPDGTLVPREEPAPQEVVAAEAAPALAPATENSAASQVAAPAAQAIAAAAQPAQAARSNVPATGPVVPSRPADQPLDVVGEVKPQQVAAAGQAAAPAGAAAAGWSVQIASQPTQEAAQSSYDALARRFGEVIGGRGVNIVKAEVSGKGTYWRVRVPAGSRDEAITLCERYKSAGGSCFVSR